MRRSVADAAACFNTKAGAKADTNGDATANDTHTAPDTQNIDFVTNATTNANDNAKINGESHATDNSTSESDAGRDRVYVARANAIADAVIDDNFNSNNCATAISLDILDAGKHNGHRKIVAIVIGSV